MTESIFTFIGVSTQGSSILRLFPLWLRELGIANASIRGVDLPLHADPETYRQVVCEIASSANHVGGLVTTHKIDLYHAAHDIFDELDANAQLCGEVSCIARKNGRLHGLALDPISSGMTLDEMLGNDYFGKGGGEVLCFGAGGAAIAIALNLVNRSAAGERPARFTVTDISAERVAHFQQVLSQRPGTIDFVCKLTPQEATNDELLTQLPPHSLVINATGMGKDRPGSPLGNTALFPMHGVVWELNYRGERLFLQQSLRQVSSRKLQIYDGWLYFLIGWTQHIAQVFDIELSRERFQRLAEIADSLR